MAREHALRAIFAVCLLALALHPLAGAAGSDTPTFTRHAAPYGLPNVHQAGAPSLGVDWLSGAVMYQAWTSTYRVEFDDVASPPVATWTDRSATSSIFNVDPVLFVDSPAGRTYAGGLNGACSVLSLSDNDGDSWSPMANTCSASIDHPSVAAGPWTPDGSLTATHPRAVYYCATASVVQCSTSQDGGRTFGPATTVTCGFFNPGLHGSLHVAPNGWVYLPFRTCGGANGVSVSTDNGLTWTGHPIPHASSPKKGFDPDVASTESGWLYVAYPTADNGVGVALTRDGGASWRDMGDVAAGSGIATATFLEVVAGDDLRAAAVYFGSQTEGDPYAEDFPGIWHVYVTYTLDGGDTWATIRASENIAHWGWVCADGSACVSNGQLFDSIDAQLDEEGRIVVAYADACQGACEMGYGASTGAHAVILRQSGGASLAQGLASGPLPAAPQRLPEVGPDTVGEAMEPTVPERARFELKRTT